MLISKAPTRNVVGGAEGAKLFIFEAQPAETVAPEEL